MRAILNSPYKNWLLISFLLFIITSYYSGGYHHFDEHFQIMEYASYKMGHTSPDALAWEFPEKIRPAIQPFIAYSIGSFLKTSGIYTPFLLTFLLRLLMAIGSWWLLSKLALLLTNDFETERGKKLFVLSCFFLWFMPYLSVRFSAENFSALFFGGALLILLKQDNRTIGRLLLAGFLLGIAWFARIQLGFALAGLAVWILFIKKWPFIHWLTLLVSACIAIALNVVIDHWFYGEWVFTPYNYFAVNILQDKAASFGELPLWGYITLFISDGVPPVSLVLLVLFIRGIWKKPAHLFSITVLFFIVGHSIISHKEMRFLFPLIFPFIYLVATGTEQFIKQYQTRKIYTISFKVLVVINILLLTYRAFTPAQETVKFYKYMYKVAANERVKLICLEQSPYTQVTLESDFYKHPNMDIIVAPNKEEIINIRDTIKTNNTVYLYTARLLNKEDINAYGAKQVYASFPDWILSFNFNNWQERSKIGAIYKLK